MAQSANTTKTMYRLLFESIGGNGDYLLNLGGNRMKISKKYRDIAQMYKYFGRERIYLMDFSESALEAIFANESHGTPLNEKTNGFAYGKRLKDITVASWKEDLGTLLFSWELYLQYPKDFIDGIVGKNKLTDQQIQVAENEKGHLYPRVDFNDLDSGDKQYYFDLLQAQYVNEEINRNDRTK
jgi:hypothetical protein